MSATASTLSSFRVRVKQEPGSAAICYVCSAPGADYPVQSRARDRGPYFPFLETHVPPLGADRPTSEGAVLACSVCYSFLTQQWEAHEQNRTPRNKRMYWLKRSDNGPFAGMDTGSGLQPRQESPDEQQPVSPLQRQQHQQQPTAALDLSLPSLTAMPAPSPPPSVAPPPHGTPCIGDLCFVCGSRNSPLASLFTKPIANCPYFPSLALHPPPPGAKPPDPLTGRAEACEQCHRSLLEQWDSYQRRATPQSERKYQLRPRAFTCFTCGLEFPVSVQRAVSALPTHDGAPGFAFLRGVAPPPGAQPLSASGQVLVCSMCFKSLQRQLRVFEISNVPEAKRHFKILHEAPSAPQPATHSVPSAATPNSVLRKQLLSPQTKYLGCYLCEKIGPLQALVTCDTSPPAIPGAPYFPFLREVVRPIAARPPDGQGRVLLCAECRADLQHQWDAFESAGLPPNQRRYHVPAQSTSVQPVMQTASLQQTVPSQGVVCYVCGEQTTETFPVSGRDDGSGGPFFPFLESHVGPDGLSGTAQACTFCFHSLMAQWLAYESSPHAEDAVRSSRRYNTHHYVCYICGITTYRRRVRTLTVCEFPFLREHPRPAGALSLRDGVVSCLTCSESLSSQWKDYERMRVPVEMRKYNWIVLPPPPEETHGVRNSPRPAVRSWWASSGGSSPSNPSDQGLAADQGKSSWFPSNPGSKLLQPTAAKLNQTSLALNATRTSSFAAALRKLAKQAVDPGLDKEGIPSLGQGLPSSKRGSSTFGHDLHSLPSPPLAASSLVPEARKALDLGSLASQQHRLEAAKMDSPAAMDFLATKRLAGPPVSDSRQDCPRGFQPYRGCSMNAGNPPEEHRHPGSLAPLHPMTPFEAGAYGYHPPPFLPPHLSHPAYRLEDPMCQYGLLRPAPPMVSAPAMPPFYRYPPAMQQQQQLSGTLEGRKDSSHGLGTASRSTDSPPAGPLGLSESLGNSPAPLLSPLNLAGNGGVSMGLAQQAPVPHLIGPPAGEGLASKEGFQALPASFPAASRQQQQQQHALHRTCSSPLSPPGAPTSMTRSPPRLESERAPTVVAAAVLSRIDLAERRRRAARARNSGAESDSEGSPDDSDGECGPRERPVVWSGPPLRLDLSPRKLQFFRHVGLTSHQKRRELELQHFLRHWTRLHGSEDRYGLRTTPSPSPHPSGGDSGKTGAERVPSPWQRPPRQLSPRRLCKEPDFQLKKQFLLLLGLSTKNVACSVAEERETIWRAIMMERSHRNGSLSRIGGYSHRPGGCLPGYLQSRCLKRKLPCVAASSAQRHNGVCSDGSPPRKVAVPPSKMAAPQSRGFAQEFHDSVLLDTHLHQQLSPRCQRPTYSIFHKRPPVAPPEEEGGEGDRPPEGETPDADGSAAAAKEGHVRPPFPWPGVQGVMEAYAHYRQERELERSLLSGRQRQLQQEQHRLQQEAQALSTRMAELYENKKLLDGERQTKQMTIDNLKKCLRLVRY
ncbi:unnamed protein product [Ixodes hexagonus]